MIHYFEMVLAAASYISRVTYYVGLKEIPILAWILMPC